MESISSVLLEALTSADSARPRSRQTQVGPSQIGGCHAQVWHTLNGTDPTNEGTSRLAAIMGTAIHASIYDALKRSDPWEERFELEVEVSQDGLTGHVDCYDRATETVWDWKTTTKKNLGGFPSQQQRWQVQVYGWLMDQSGYPVKRVGLVGIARDGHEGDVVEVVEPYDLDQALEALEWLRDVQAADAPVPERTAGFCRSYCDFFGACPGKAGGSDAVEMPLPVYDAQRVMEYVDAKAAADAAKARMDAARDALVGVQGVADGWSVAWTQRQNTVLDRDAVKAALGEVPMKASSVSDVLSVKQVK